MEDRARFAESSLKAINLPNCDGETMIAASRAILRSSYSDDEYKNEFFAIFILIDEETGDIVLDGFGEFNVASERYALEKSRLENAIKVMSRMPANMVSPSNSRLYQSEIEDIADSYHEQFLSSLRDFKAYFELEGAAGGKTR